MTLNGWLQILIFFALVLAVTKPLGIFMVHVFNREKTFLDPVLRPIERLIRIDAHIVGTGRDQTLRNRGMVRTRLGQIVFAEIVGAYGESHPGL